MIRGCRLAAPLPREREYVRPDGGMCGQEGVCAAELGDVLDVLVGVLRPDGSMCGQPLDKVVR